MKTIVFILIAAVQLIVGAAAFFMLLVAMNGFSETDASPGLLMYIVLTLGSAVGHGAAGVCVAKRLSAASVGNFGAALISIAGFAIIGTIILLIGWVAALFLAQIVREWK